MSEVLVEQIPPRPRPSEGYTAEWWDTQERKSKAKGNVCLEGADWMVEFLPEDTET